MADPLFVRNQQPQTSLLFAASQLQGTRESQEDYFVNFNDECFVVCDGVGGLPHGEVASELAGDTAVWAYRHVRQRRTYWLDKKLFLKRIFRSTNITLWQKQREPGFEDGMGTTMLVCIVSDRRFYIGNVGDSAAFLMHDREMTKVTHEDRDSEGRLTKVVGTTRYGLAPSIVSGDFLAGDSMILVTDGVARVMESMKCSEFFEHVEKDARQLSDAATSILQFAESQNVTDNMTVCLIKRVGQSLT